MSQQAVAEFFAKVDTDAALQQEVVKALEGKEDESMLMEAATAFAQVGALHGYDFTPQEAAAKYQEMVANSVQGWGENGGELSDEALEMVAGGMMRWRPHRGPK